MKSNNRVYNIYEARREADKNKKVSSIDEINEILNSVNIENLFLSFRTDIHAAVINKRTEYQTPVGLYTYPLIYYVNRKNFSDISRFRDLFPYLSNLPNIIFYTLTDFSKIMSVNTDKSVVLDKAESILNYVISLKSNDEEVKGLAYEYYEKVVKNIGNNTGYRSDYLGYSNVYAPGVPCANLWYYIYDMTALVYSSIQRGYSILCLKNGINGFIDYGLGFIHTNEMAQTVFFSDKIFSGKRIVIDKKDKRVNFVNTDTDDKIIKYLKNNPERISDIKSDVLKNKIVVSMPDLFKFIKSPSEKLKKIAVMLYADNIRYIDNQTKILKKLALNSFKGSAIYFKDVDFGILKEVFKEHPELIIDYIIEKHIIPDLDILKMAISKYVGGFLFEELLVIFKTYNREDLLNDKNLHNIAVNAFGDNIITLLLNGVYIHSDTKLLCFWDVSLNELFYFLENYSGYYNILNDERVIQYLLTRLDKKHKVLKFYKYLKDNGLSTDNKTDRMYRYVLKKLVS